MVTATAASHIEAMTSQTEALGGSDSRRNSNLALAVKRWNFHSSAESRFPGSDRHIDFCIVAFHDELRVRLLAKSHIEVSAIRSATWNSDPAVVTSAGRNADVDCFLGITKADGQLPHRSSVHVFQRKR